MESWSSSKCLKPDPTHLTRNQNPPIYATIGFYDAEGNLLETIKDCELDVKDMYRVAELPVNAKKSNKATKNSRLSENSKGFNSYFATDSIWRWV